LASNAAVPFGAPYDDGGVYPTWWISASDVTNRTYYFWSTRSPSLLWVDLSDLAGSNEVRSLNPRDPSLVGDVTGMLAPAELPY
jgi:choloylglycine hydrolase